MSEEWVWESEKGTFIVISVRPSSREKTFIHSMSNDEIVLNISSPAKDGKANTELVKRFAKTLGLSTVDVILAAGHKSKTKTLIIQNISKKELIQKLSQLQNG